MEFEESELFFICCIDLSMFSRVVPVQSKKVQSISVQSIFAKNPRDQ
jgi:hypothetical protein